MRDPALAACQQQGGWARRFVDAVSIHERPASADDRAVPGHWVGDLPCGSANSFIVTLFERHSRYAMLVPVANRDRRSVVDALIEPATSCRTSWPD